MCVTVLHVVSELSKAETENIFAWEHIKVTVSLHQQLRKEDTKAKRERQINS